MLSEWVGFEVSRGAIWSKNHDIRSQNKNSVVINEAINFTLIYNILFETIDA